MEFKGLMERGMAIRALYGKLEQQTLGSAWTSEEVALGFVGDVGDLVKLVMAHNGRWIIPDAKSKLAHELADCLWSVIVLAHLHNIDLEQAFLDTMTELEVHLTETAG